MICANSECKKNFNPKTHNQKYCTDECCRIATNRRIMEKYYEKKAIRGGSARPCVRCKAQLSRYNNSNLCSGCEKSVSIETKNKLFGMINDIS